MYLFISPMVVVVGFILWSRRWKPLFIKIYVDPFGLKLAQQACLVYSWVSLLGTVYTRIILPGKYVKSNVFTYPWRYNYTV